MTQRITKCVPAALALVLACLPTVGSGTMRSNPLSFERIDANDGLSQSTVMDIHQDAHGFVWLGTENGLNRYGGHEIRTYYRRPGQRNELPSDFIWAIDEDPAGNLWLGTDDSGVVRWERDSGRFQQIRLTSRVGEDLSQTRVYSLLVASDGTIWVGTRNDGVLALTADGRPFAQYLSEPENHLGSSRHAITSLAESHDGKIWVGSQLGVHAIQPGSSHVVSYLLDKNVPSNQTVSTNNIARVIVDRSGDVWIATYNAGISKLDPQTGKFRHYTTETTEGPRLASNHVPALLQDTDGRIWVGTQAGITLIFPDGSYQTVQHEPGNQYSLPNNFIMSLEQDQSGLIWVGTRGGGVAVWNPRSWSLGPRTPRALSGQHVNAFLERDKGEVWIGTIDSGLVAVDSEGASKPVESIAGFTPEQTNVMSLLRDSNGIIWIGTQTDGLLRYDPATRDIESMPVAPRRTDALGAPGIMSLAEGPPGTIWVGTYNGGVARIDSESLAIQRLGFQGSLAGLERSRATVVEVFDDRELWIGTESNGLAMVDLVSGQARRFRGDAVAANHLPSNTIYSLYADSGGDIWIGAGAQGLARLHRASLDQTSPRFSVLSTANGLASNVIFGILPDEQGRLWLSSNNGLMRLSPDTQEIRSFHEGHGSFSNEFNFGAHYQGRDGRLYFGGPGGFNVIDPQSVEWNKQPPHVLVTDIFLFGESLADGKPPYLRQNLQLAHNEDVIAFEFTATDYAAPKRNLYSVKLDGFDKQWSAPSTRTRATYTNLDPGRYTLLIKAANSDGVWTPTPYSLPIEVLRAPWATWWAYALYATAIILLVWWLLRLKFAAQERVARFNQLAFYDRVTGLPNRELFQQRVGEQLRRPSVSEGSLAVLCIRVLVPKRITQSLPQETLNEMWQTLAGRLMRALHGHEQIAGRRDLARLDADQFLVFVHGSATQDVALGERLRLICTESITLGEHRVPITAIVGMARAPDHASTAELLIRYAATAASSQMQAPAAGVLIYNEAMTAQVQSRLMMETRLRLAIANDKLELYLQPKYDTGRQIVGAEALLRWHDEDDGWIPPALFVTLAEESNLIVELDTWVIHKALNLLATWHQQALVVPQIAINLSAANLGDQTIVKRLIEACDSAGVPPEQLQVELTESALLTDLEQTRDALRLLKAHGFSIALDDFGTGYSSLTHLKTFAIDTVKIDREFVQDVDSKGQHASICNAIIALANSLQLNTVAEGVETEAQLAALQQLGCQEMQGYLLAKPMPVSEFARLIQPSATG